MLTSISPLGERARGNRWGLTAACYVGASVVGGASMGGLLGAVGELAFPPLPLLAAAVLLVCAFADLTGLMPRGRRQVDEDWLTRYRGWVYGSGFGFQLGLGVVTIVTSAATYAVLALALLAGSFGVGLAVGATFGLVRALPLLALRAADTPTAVRVAAQQLDALRGVASRSTLAVLAGAAVLLVAA